MKHQEALKKLLKYGIAAFCTVSAETVLAADQLMPEPEPIEYIRVCDAWGEGYFYIPGTDTCLRISGYVRSDLKGGNNPAARRYSAIKQNSYHWRIRTVINFHTAKNTDLGSLRTFVQLRSQWDDGHDSESSRLLYGFIDLGGLRIGVDDSIFWRWNGYFGRVIYENTIAQIAYARTNTINYTYNAANGFSAIIGFEQGTGEFLDSGDLYHWSQCRGRWKKYKKISNMIDDYTPHIVGGLKYTQDWGKISVTGAYDSYYDEWAVKARLDLNITEKLSIWMMGAYKTQDDFYTLDYVDKHHRNRYRRLHVSTYGSWGGDWVAWGGGAYEFTQKATFNAQLSYDDADTFMATANIMFKVLPGVMVTPEITYSQWDDKKQFDYNRADGRYNGLTSLKGENALQGMVRLQRSF